MSVSEDRKQKQEIDEKVIGSLVKEAMIYRLHAYAPYSHFQVGAAVLGEDGRIFGGCNIENASYGATNCAERTAVFKAVSEGCQRLLAVAVIGGPEGEIVGDYAYPCGICRQVLYEFGGDELLVIVAKNTEEYQKFTLGELLPHGFGKEELR